MESQEPQTSLKQNPPRVTSLFVKRLFGAQDAKFTLSESAITLMFGHNGCGKSTLLRIMDRILSNDLASLVGEPFEQATVSFSDGSSVMFDREKQIWKEKYADSAVTASGPIELNFKGKEFASFIEEETPYTLVGGKIVSSADFKAVSQEVEALIRDRWQMSLGMKKNNQSKRRSRGRSLPNQTDEPSHDMPLVAHRKIIRQTRLIISDRLKAAYQPSSNRFRFRPSFETNIEPRYRVQEVSEQLKVIISRARESAREKSAELDSRSFKQILALAQSTGDLTSDRIQSGSSLQNMKADLNTLNQRLIKCALSTSKLDLPEFIPELGQTVRLSKLFELHIGDLIQKARATDDVLQRLEALLKIINLRFVGKLAELSADQGLLVKREADNVTIPLARLSSGEQHMVVLFHSLIFDTIPGGICLIDEPEISLNVDWQECFLEDLEAVSKISRLQFIIATHSPQIVGKHASVLRHIETL